MIESNKNKALAASSESVEGSVKDIAKGRLVIRVRTAITAGLLAASDVCTSKCDCHSSCDCHSGGTKLKA
jgi:hypothetical protein